MLWNRQKGHPMVLPFRDGSKNSMLKLTRYDKTGGNFGHFCSIVPAFCVLKPSRRPRVKEKHKKTFRAPKSVAAIISAWHKKTQTIIILIKKQLLYLLFMHTGYPPDFSPRQSKAQNIQVFTVTRVLQLRTISYDVTKLCKWMKMAFSFPWWKRSTGWLESWVGLLLTTHVSAILMSFTYIWWVNVNWNSSKLSLALWAVYFKTTGCPF